MFPDEDLSGADMVTTWPIPHSPRCQGVSMAARSQERDEEHESGLGGNMGIVWLRTVSQVPGTRMRLRSVISDHHHRNKARFGRF